ncbi:hypothetical protein SAMN05216391_13313 [Lachnospiraceae bacterium KHCPX20]|jgi:hypothetical protein|nr:hypothetical protein SAMN05216391_13313 [Lachnospiraceae bacterium KHCPX20]
MSGIPLNCGSIEARKAKRELKLFDEVHLLKEELERMDYNAMNGATDKQLKKDITKVYNRLHSIIEE